MPSIIPWRTSTPSDGTSQLPRLHRVPLADKDPEDDVTLFMATKDPKNPVTHIRQIKTPNTSSAPSYPRSPPLQFRSRGDVESETSPTRDLRASDGAESDFEKPTSQPQSNLKDYSESSLLSSPITFLYIRYKHNRSRHHRYRRRHFQRRGHRCRRFQCRGYRRCCFQRHGYRHHRFRTQCGHVRSRPVSGPYVVDHVY